MDEFEELLSWIEDPKNSQTDLARRESKADHLDDFDRMFQQMSSVQKAPAGAKQDPRISMLLQDLGQEMEYEKKKQATMNPPKQTPKAQTPKQSIQPVQTNVRATRAEEDAANDLLAQLLGPQASQPAPASNNPPAARTLSQQLQRDAETLARELEEEALSLALKQPAQPYVPPASAPAPRASQPVVDIRQQEIER